MRITETLEPNLQDDAVLEKLLELNPGDGLELVRGENPQPLLERLLREAPLRYDFSPLEAGPGRWRFHIHVREEPVHRSVSRYLAWDHDRLDDILNRAMELGRGEQWEEAAALAAEFRIGLFRHIEIEEAILFKAFEEVTGMREGGPTEVMRHEHVDIKESVDGILQASVDRSLDDLERNHANLLGVLIEHNMKEENILYPLTDRSLDEFARASLVEDLMLH
jgi:uncharacterized protein (DUF2249 family)